MSIKEIIKQYQKEIYKTVVDEKKEEEMLEKLDEIEDLLLELEREIEDQREALEEYNNTVEDAESEFLSANALPQHEFRRY